MPTDPLARVVMDAVEESRQRDIQRANEEMDATQRRLDAAKKEHPEMLPSRRMLLVLGITGEKQPRKPRPGDLTAKDFRAMKESVKITERRSRKGRK